MATSKLAAGGEASPQVADCPTSVVLRDAGELRHHTWKWLCQLGSRDAIYPLFCSGVTGLPFAHRVAWRVFWNKLRVFRWFARVDSARRGTSRNLKALATRLSNDPTFANLYRTEGLGYYATMTALRHKVGLSGVLGRDTRLPGNCLIPFHLGVGMALSFNALHATTYEADDGDLHDALAGLHAVCRDEARPGFARLVVEPLGFVAVNYYRPLIPRVAELLSRIDLELCDYFWHGIGRGLYFCPESFLPYRNLGWHAPEAARRLAPDDPQRAACLAGLSFASTLVNIRHPRHLEFFLAGHDNDADDTGAIASGVQAAMVVWYRWSQTSKHIDALGNFQPHAESAAADRWRRLVSEPCRLSMTETHPRIAGSGRFENLFRYRGKLTHES